MYACVLLHNMIVDDEGDNVTAWNDYAIASSSILSDPPTQGVSLNIRNVMAREIDMREEHAHTCIQADLIEEFWTHINIFQH